MPRWVVLLGVVVSLPGVGRADDWPQFRGPSGRSVAGERHRLPARIGPEQNVLWKVALPPGHSSPVLCGDRIYLTAVRDKALLTMALDRATGRILWETPAPYKQLEKIHQIGSHAQGSPATDGSVVVSFFGSTGLHAYDSQGKQLWHVPLGPFKNDLGAGSSPVLAGDKVILNQDHDLGSFLLAVDKKTGTTLWKADRSSFPVSYATPVLWEVGGRTQVVVAGSLRVTGYDLETGKEVWVIRGLARAVHMTPTVGPDNTLYVAGWTAGGDDDDRFDVPAFEALLAKQDANRNGTLEKQELPPGPLESRFGLIDRDKDEHITKDEYDFMKRVFDGALNRVMAIRPGGRGDVTETHVLWAQRKHLPVVPSPLWYRGHLYLMRNGGLVATLDAATGRLVKEERVPGGGDYYASPVAGDGKVYLLGQRGHLTVLGAAGDWKVLHRARFDEDGYATPALADGRIYLRTSGHLYCFGEKP